MPGVAIRVVTVEMLDEIGGRVSLSAEGVIEEDTIIKEREKKLRDNL